MTFSPKLKTARSTPPLISVLTVVYNGVSTIESTIISVITQTYVDFEYVVIDGGSTDGTLDVLAKYNESIDYWSSEKDNGIYDAINKGLEYVTGKWVIILGCDDVLLDCLEKVSRELLNSNTIYYGNALFTKSRLVYDGPFSSLKICKKNICHQSIFYPESVFKAIRYSLRYPLLADYDYNIRCWGRKECSFKYLPITVSIFNQNGSCNKSLDLAFLREKFFIVGRNISWTYALYFYLVDTAKATLKRMINYDK